MPNDIRDTTYPFKPNDPVEAARYFANKMAFTTGPVELSSAQKGGADFVLIDVREQSDFQREHIPGAISLPKDGWETLDGLQKDKLNVFYCYSHVCHLAARACVFFAEKGYPVMELEGGFKVWKENKLPTEGPAEAASTEAAGESADGRKKTWAA